MLRVFGLFAVAGASAHLAINNGRIGGVDLTAIPLELVGFLAVTCGLIFTLRYI